MKLDWSFEAESSFHFFSFAPAHVCASATTRPVASAGHNPFCISRLTNNFTNNSSSTPTRQDGMWFSCPSPCPLIARDFRILWHRFPPRSETDQETIRFATPLLPSPTRSPPGLAAATSVSPSRTPARLRRPSTAGNSTAL
jgi:hypothetical protein